MSRNDLPKILFDKIRMVEPYPNGVVPVPEMVDTTAFFPGGTGLWNCNEQSKSPTILVLGQDFSNVVEYEKILNKIVKDTDCATWRNLLKVFKEAGVKLEDCFFSNVFMGLRETASMTGEFPGYVNDEFMDKNLKFLNFQIETIKPKLIITLGKYAAEMINRISSEDLVNWKDFNALRGGDIGFVKDVSFGEMKVDCVALEHPSMRVPNVWRREYCDSRGTSYKGNDAEINMMKDALKKLGNIQVNKTDDKVIHINIMDARGKVYCKKLNSVVKLDFDVCFTCTMLGGSAQGEGVECLWEDKGLTVPYFNVYNPKAEFERVNENLKKLRDEYYTENEKAFGDLLRRIRKEMLDGND
jgi:hypothetical protein